jgi:integrase
MPNTLTAGQISALKTPGLHRVDRGLYVQVRPNGAKSWLYRFMLRGKARAMGLGPVRVVPLTEARAKVVKAERMRLDGEDPIDARRGERAALMPVRAVPTFKECAEAYIESQRAGWKNEKHAYQWTQSLTSYAFPTIGARAVTAVTLEDIVTILKPIWTTKSETAGRLRGRIESVLDWAVAKGHRAAGVNPASWRGPLGKLLPSLSKVQTVVHHPSVPYAEIPALFRKVTMSDTSGAAALAFVMLTAVRPGEARGARWQEFDFKAKTWTIPASRMKMSVAHVVPLSDAAVALLPSQPGKPDELVFPGTRPGKELSDMTLLKLIRKLRGDDSTVHGLRSSFRTWAAEKTDYPSEIAEASLAHLVGDEVQRAYLRTTFLDKRAALMTDWAEHCTRGRGLGARRR